LRAYAYINSPLPVGYGKTISQPFIVALMTDLLELKPDDVTLRGRVPEWAIRPRSSRSWSIASYSIELIEELALTPGKG